MATPEDRPHVDVLKAAYRKQRRAELGLSPQPAPIDVEAQREAYRGRRHAEQLRSDIMRGIPEPAAAAQWAIHRAAFLVTFGHDLGEMPGAAPSALPAAPPQLAAARAAFARAGEAAKARGMSLADAVRNDPDTRRAYIALSAAERPK